MIKSTPKGAEVSMAFRTGKTFELELDSFASTIRLPDLAVDLIASLKTIEPGFGHLNLKSSTPLFLSMTCKNKAAAKQLLGMANVVVD